MVQTLTCNAVVSGVLGHHETNAMFLGLLNRQLHAVRANVEAQAKVAVHQGGGGSLLEDLDGLVGVQNAVLDAIEVDRFQATNAVGIDATLVCLDQDVRGDAGFLRRNADGLESVNHEGLKVIEVQTSGTLNRLVLVRTLLGTVVHSTGVEEIKHLLTDSDNHVRMGSTGSQKGLQVGIVLKCNFTVGQVLGIGNNLRSLLSQLLNTDLGHSLWVR